jgi:hypothetical protein
VRDESLHCEGIIKLFHAFVKERDCLTKSVKNEIRDVCHHTVALEDAFIDLAFEMGPVEGMTAKQIKKYIRYIADWRMGQLGFAPIYMVDEHPLPWLAPMLNGVEHANFFETRATEYSKAATRGSWNDVWDSDRRCRSRYVLSRWCRCGMTGTGTRLGHPRQQPSQTASVAEDDRRQKAKGEAANDGPDSEGGEPDMFGQADAAAE